MIKIIKYDDVEEEFVVTMHIPRTMTGTYVYDKDRVWEQDAVCVWIDNSRYEYGLYNTQYLDYKDSLQATSPIFHFDSQTQAEAFAAKYGLMIEYSSQHDHFSGLDD